MGGFLESLGRTNALSNASSTIFQNAVNLRKQQEDENQGAITNAINLEKLSMAKESHGIDNRIKTIQAQELEAQQKILDSPYDITTDPRYLSLPPEAQKTVLNHAVTNKYTDQNGLGTKRTARQLLADVESKSELFSASMGPLVESRKKAATDAWAAYQEAKAAGDPKKTQQALAIFQARSLEYQSTQAGFSTHLSKLNGSEKGKVVGFDPTDKKAVNEDAEGNLTKDGAPYAGGQLLPITSKDTDDEPPKSRNRDVGDKIVTEEWSKKDKAWVKVSDAPRWNERGSKREDRLAANQQFKNERDMRQDFEKLPEVKNYNDMNIKAAQMAQAMEEAKKTGNFVAVDQALITTYNKMTDPQSVVRESEYARTSNDISVINAVRGKADKVLRGGAGLTSDERNALKIMSDRFLSASKERYDSVADEYRGLAKTYGYEPNNVVFRGASKKGAGTGAVKTADEFLKKYGGK